MHAAVLGLESLLHQRHPPVLSTAWGELDHQCLVVHVQGYHGHDCEVMRTHPLPDSMLNVLRFRPEVLLLWVDVPLRQPLAHLATVGLKHIWTGIAPVRGADAREPTQRQEVQAGTVST